MKKQKKDIFDTDIADYITDWIEYREKVGSIKKTTARHYRTMVKPFCDRYRDERTIDDFSAADVQDFTYDDVVKHGVKTAAHRFTILKAALTSAYHQLPHRHRVNPFCQVDRPRVPPQKKPDVLTKAQLNDLYGAASADKSLAGLATIVAICTGARRGELAALRWSDVFGGGIDINKTSVIGKKHIYTSSPKSAKAIRFITLPTGAERMLEDFRGSNDGQKLVFETLRPDTLADRVRDIMNKADIPEHFTLHDLRHAHATHLLADGVPLASVSARLGHSKVTTTLNTYAHALEADQKMINSALNRMLSTRA